MNKQYVIDRMSKEEVKLAITWADKEGWNPGAHDHECFYLADPRGFFVGKLDGKIIAVGSAVIYDAQFAFCGFYIVDSLYRGQGYGMALTRERLSYVGNRNAGIDGVTNMLDKYERIGYKLAHNNARYCGQSIHPKLEKDIAIVSLKKVNFDELQAYDRRHFPAARTNFLKCWINQPEGESLGFVRDGKLCGYGVIRACQHGFKIAPLFADEECIAEQLFLNLISYAKGSSIYIDIPENNPDAVALVKRYQLEKVFETARMYLKGQPEIEMAHVYGMTSFELG